MRQRRCETATGTQGSHRPRAGQPHGSRAGMLRQLRPKRRLQAAPSAAPELRTRPGTAGTAAARRSTRGIRRKAKQPPPIRTFKASQLQCRILYALHFSISFLV